MYSHVQNMNQANFTVLEDIFPLNKVAQNNYGMMSPSYNSNPIIPAYDAAVPPSPATQYIENLQRQYPNAVYAQGMLLPRSTSYDKVSREQTAPMVQYGQFTFPPGFAGGLPYMKDAIMEDKSIVMNPFGEVGPVVQSTPSLQKPLSMYPMNPPNITDWNNLGMYGQTVSEPRSNMESMMSEKRNPVESFRYQNKSIDCGDIDDHLKVCSRCNGYFRCDNKTYLVLMIMMMLVFLTIFYLLQRKQ
jgi:hypothetical protein